MSSSLLEILALMEQVIIAQEAESDKVMKKVGFSETEQEVDFTNFQSQLESGYTYPWRISSPTNSFDQKDLDVFVNRFTTDTSQSNGFYNNISPATITTRMTSFKKTLEPLIQIRPFLPEEVQNNYNEKLIESIDRIRKYWIDPKDRIEKKQDKETLRLIGMLIMRNASAVMQNFDDLKSLSDEFIRDYTEFIKSSEEEMQAGASSITRPQVQTTRLPKNLQDYSTLMNTFFKDQNTLEERVNHLKELGGLFSLPKKQLQDKTEVMPRTKFMSYVVMMDYLVEIVKSFDSQTGRYLLEYLLAVVAMGQVVGATPGSAGQQDAVDFQTPEGLGSSKFISNYDKVYQSVVGFESYVGQPITYVVALKEGSPMRLTSKAPEPVEVQSLKVHIFNVTLTEDPKEKKVRINNKSVPVKQYVFNYGSENTRKIINSRLLSKPKQEKKWSPEKLDIGDIAQEQPSFTIPLAFTTEKGTKTYRQMLSTSLGETRQELLLLVKSLFDELKKADEMSRKYTVSGNPKDGDAALTSLENSQKSLKTLKANDSEDPNNQ